jgi:type II secretory pathway pseudopilin PulG
MRGWCAAEIGTGVALPQGMTNLIADRGTTLVEAVIAIGILAGAVVALAGLSSLAVRTSALARERSVTTLLALQKMESVCRDVAAVPVSPANAWAVDTPGYLEYLDSHGNSLAGGSGGTYVRRWSVTPLPSDANLLAIQVAVSPCRTLPGASRCGDSGARVRLASIRSRIAW